MLFLASLRADTQLKNSLRQISENQVIGIISLPSVLTAIEQGQKYFARAV